MHFCFDRGSKLNADFVSQNRQEISEQFDSSMWDQSIKESSEDENIKIFFTRDASLLYQESVLAAEYMILDNLNKNQSYDDDILFFYDYDLYDENKYNAKDWQNEYENSQSDSNFKLITNTSQLDSAYNTNYKLYPTDGILQDLVSYYDAKYDGNYTFDLWIVDASLEELYDYNSYNYDFMKHVDKVYVLSDGNYQTYYFINDAIARYQTSGYVQLTSDEIDQKWQNYRNDVNDTYKSDYDSYTLYDFINDANIFTFFHTRSYTDSPYYQENVPSGITLYKTYDINYNYYDFVINNITSTNEQKTFISDYENFFLISGKTSIEDFFVRNSESYDPNKKDVFWFGGSILTNVDQVYPQKTEEWQNIVQSWLKLFPPSEYNFIFQPHPVYTMDENIEMTKWLIQSDNDSNIIYFGNFPWELFLSWNYKMQQNNGENNYTGLFGQNFGSSNIPAFIGFQFTSTVIQTTAFFIQDFYNYSLDEVEQTLNPYYFPILQASDEITKTTSFSVSPEEQLQKNEQEINEMYLPYVYLNTYPDYRKDWVSATDFIRQNYNHNYSIKLSTKNSRNNMILVEALVPIAVIIMVVILSIYFIIRHDKYKKFKHIKT